MLKRQMAEAGEETADIDVELFIKEQGNDLGKLKAMLA
jgi:hypothetical protein